MTPQQIRLARSLAQSDVNLDHVNYDVLIGCACADFKPVTVGIECVARLMRYQCRQMDGGWDEKTYNEDVEAYRRNVTLATASREDFQSVLIQFCQQRLTEVAA